MGRKDFLDTPITEEDLKAALSKDLVTIPRKVTISVCSFSKLTGTASRVDMSIIFSWTFLNGRIMEQQKHGIVVCILKNDISTTPMEYRENYCAEHIQLNSSP